jgi:hypothetical protein
MYLILRPEKRKRDLQKSAAQLPSIHHQTCKRDLQNSDVILPNKPAKKTFRTTGPGLHLTAPARTQNSGKLPKDPQSRAQTSSKNLKNQVRYPCFYQVSAAIGRNFAK